jgi:hypothetical protein
VALQDRELSPELFSLFIKDVNDFIAKLLNASNSQTVLIEKQAGLAAIGM